MKQNSLCDGCGKAVVTKKKEIHHAENYGIPITLYNTAEEISCGCSDKKPVRVPKQKKLIQAVALYRATVPARLNSQEISFIRDTLGFSAQAFAKKLSVDPSTLSRWENGAAPIGIENERLVRMFTVKALQSEAQGIKAELEDILEMQIKGFPIEGKFVEMGFTLSRFQQKDHYADIELAA